MKLSGTCHAFLQGSTFCGGYFLSRLRVKSNRPGLFLLCHASRLAPLCCSLSWFPRRLSLLQLLVSIPPATLALEVNPHDINQSTRERACFTVFWSRHEHVMMHLTQEILTVGVPVEQPLLKQHDWSRVGRRRAGGEATRGVRTQPTSLLLTDLSQIGLCLQKNRASLLAVVENTL